MKEAHAIQMNSKTSTHEIFYMADVMNIQYWFRKASQKVKGCVKHVVVFHPRGCHYDKRGPPSIPDFIQLKVMWTHYLKHCPFKWELNLSTWQDPAHCSCTRWCSKEYWNRFRTMLSVLIIVLFIQHCSSEQVLGESLSYQHQTCKPPETPV